MARPKKCRIVGELPDITYFKPRGVQIRYLKEYTLTIDELESIKLADFMELDQEKSSEKMGVSRQTFGRILNEARKKIAQAIITGGAIRIEGGNFVSKDIVCNDECCSNCAESEDEEKDNL
jgi:predicted DNA-binding protein (UPF0251 family)